MLTNVDAVKRELRQGGVYPDPTDDLFVLERIDAAVSRVFEVTGRRFDPYIETRYYDARTFHQGGFVDGDTLYLSAPLLELISLSIGGTAQEIADFTPLPMGDGVKWKIRRPNNTWSYIENPTNAIAIAGIWGYKTDTSMAWIASQDGIQSDVSDSAVTLTVIDSNGEDALFKTPRFSPGMVIRINSEFMQVRKVIGNTLSVFRGLNGSTKAAHTSGALIDIWNPETAIALGVTRWCAMMYKRRGEFARREVEGMNAKEYPKDMPEDFKATLRHYKSINPVHRVGSFYRR